jgi:hypothetical protein
MFTNTSEKNVTMSQNQIRPDMQSLEQRIQRLEGRVARWAKRMKKIDSDSPLLPSMDDFNYSENEFATADSAFGSLEWTAPFTFPNGNTRGLTWDSGSGGSLFVNSSAGFIDTTGELLSFVDAVERSPDGIDTAYRFVKPQYRFYYRHPDRAGQLKITATFQIKNARINDCVHDQKGADGAIDLLEFQNLRIAAYRQLGDAWEQFGKVVDEYHELTWDVRQNTPEDRSQSYDRNRQNGQHTVAMTSRVELTKGQLTKFYVGIWSGLTLWTHGFGYTTFNRFDVRLAKVRAELI